MNNLTEPTPDSATPEMVTTKNTKHLNIIIIVLSILCVIMLGKIILFENILVQHTSMFPTIAHGDTVTLLKTDKIDRFDIIVFEDIEDADKKLIKRVIGIGGDTLTIDENGLLHVSYIVDGVVVNDVFEENYINSLNVKVDEFVVPNGMLYVLGDNRLVSRDSTEFGPIPEDAVIGKVVFLD